MSKVIRAAAVVAVLAGVITACGGGPAARAEVVTADESDDEGRCAAGAGIGSAEPSGDEIDGLLRMREEEKLARDVYLTLFDRWGAAIFENIAASEQRHTDAVLDLISAFGLEDPVVDDTRGVFTNPEFAVLYAELVEQGSVSLVDALAVGALIEEMDIRDLRRWVEAAENPDIVQVYGNLLSGSENHLRAFVGRLEANGGTFSPSYLDAEDVQAILDGSPDRGRGGRGGGGRGRRP